MPTSKTWPGGATDSSPTSYSIPSVSEVNWQALSSFLSALADSAQTTTFQKWKVRKATSSPVTVAATSDCVVVTDLGTPGAVTVNLPAGANKQVFFVVDGKGDAGTNNITVNANGSDTIRGAASLTIASDYGGVVLAYNSGDTDWKVIGETIGSVVPIARGGTGETTANAALNALLPSQATASGKVLTSDGTDTSWGAALTTTLTDGQIFIGNASNEATARAVTGDVTISNTGVTAIASGVIVDADINGSAAISGSKLQAAGASNAGAVTTGSQTLAGDKTLTGTTTIGATTGSSQAHLFYGGNGTSGPRVRLYNAHATSGNAELTLGKSGTDFLQIFTDGASNGSGDVSILAPKSDGNFKFYTGGSAGGNLNMSLSSAGVATLGPTPSGTSFVGHSITGVRSGANASAGYIGEVISSQVVRSSALSVTSDAAGALDVTSITLTPGDWEITGSIAFSGGATSFLFWQGAYSTTSAAVPGNDTYAIQMMGGNFAASTVSLANRDFMSILPVWRVNITSNTTYYLVARATFNGGAATASAYGFIQGRRMR